MITGFNTDIKHNDKVYHIQTEDKGLQNPYIESLVYVGGEILASAETLHDAGPVVSSASRDTPIRGAAAPISVTTIDWS